MESIAPKLGASVSIHCQASGRPGSTYPRAGPFTFRSLITCQPLKLAAAFRAILTSAPWTWKSSDRNTWQRPRKLKSALPAPRTPRKAPLGSGLQRGNGRSLGRRAFRLHDAANSPSKCGYSCQCPLWVKSSHWADRERMAALGVKRTFRWPGRNDRF